MDVTMNSRERWLKTIRDDRADRVPIAAPIWWDPLWRAERPERITRSSWM